MNPTRTAVLLLAAAALAARDASAQSATQTLTYEVAPVDQLSVTGAPTLVANSAIAGSNLAQVNATAAYAITTNGTNRKITASLDSNLPTGMTLRVSLAAPVGATSSGMVHLDATPRDVVTGITRRYQANLPIQYNLSADVTAGVVPAGNRTVTFTITQAP